MSKQWDVLTNMFNDVRMDALTNEQNIKAHEHREERYRRALKKVEEFMNNLPYPQVDQDVYDEVMEALYS